MTTSHPDVAADPLNDAEHLTWPASRFYWSLLDARGWSTRGELPVAFRLQLEENVPAGDATPLHAVGIPVDDEPRRLLVCAIPRSELAAISPSTQTLCPDAIPMPLELLLSPRAATLDPGTINLLVGDFESRVSIRRRVRRHLTRAVLIVAVSALTAVGFDRRARHQQIAAEALADARTAELRHAGVRDPSELQRQLRRESALAELSQRSSRSRSAAESLAAILAAWPENGLTNAPSLSTAVPRSLAITDTRISMTVSVPGDAARWLREFSLNRDGQTA